MKQVVYYPAFDVEQTYIGATAEEIDNIRDEVEEDMHMRYGVGWNSGIEIRYDETCPLCGCGNKCTCRDNRYAETHT